MIGVRDIPVWARVALVAVAGLAAGAAWPPPPIPKGAQQAASWSLPGEEALGRFSSDDFQTASRGLRWDGAGAVGVAKKTWRLAGFLNEPATAALIEVEGVARRATQVKPGDSLPDGSVVVDIGHGTITTELLGCRRVQALYRPKTVSTSENCDTGVDEPETRKSK